MALARPVFMQLANRDSFSPSTRQASPIIVDANGQCSLVSDNLDKALSGPLFHPMASHFQFRGAKLQLSVAARDEEPVNALQLENPIDRPAATTELKPQYATGDRQTDLTATGQRHYSRLICSHCYS